MSWEDVYLSRAARYYSALSDYCRVAREKSALRALENEVKKGASKQARREVERRYGNAESFNRALELARIYSCVAWQVMLGHAVRLKLDFKYEPTISFIRLLESPGKVNDAFCASVQKRALRFAGQAESGRSVPLWGPSEFLDAYASRTLQERGNNGSDLRKD